MKVHSLSFKALENPWTVTFKRYFLVHFAENSAIFTTSLSVVDQNTILRQLFLFLDSLLYSSFTDVIYSARVHHAATCTPRQSVAKKWKNHASAKTPLDELRN